MRENQEQRDTGNSLHHVFVPYRFVVADDTTVIISLVPQLDLCFKLPSSAKIVASDLS